MKKTAIKVFCNVAMPIYFSADWFFMTLDFVRSVICDWEKRKTLTDL